MFTALTELHSGYFGVLVSNLTSLFFPLTEQRLTFYCVWNLLGRHEDLIDSFAESFPEVKGNETLCLALDVWNKKQKHILICPLKTDDS